MSAPKLTLAHDATARTRVHARWTDDGRVELFEGPADARSPTDYPFFAEGSAAPAPGAPILRMSPADAGRLERELIAAMVCAERLEELAAGRVAVQWCRADGRALDTFALQRECTGRIVERTATAVRLLVTPGRGMPEPPFGWPARDGWYRVADGWPVDHAARRRGWRATGLADVLRAGAMP